MVLFMYIKDIRRIFPQIKIEEEGFLGLLTPESSLGYLAEGLRAYKEGKDDPEWKQVFLWYQGRKEWEPVLRQLIDGAFYVYQRESLGSKAAMALYGERPVSSVTRLEAFASCAYAHFLNYGLNLRERREYELKAADFGNIYHNALELFFDKLSEKGVSLGSITEDLRYQLVEESVREVTEGYGNRILGSSAKNRFLTEQIMAVTDRTVWALGNQLSLGDFETTDAELTFLPGDRLKSMQLMTEDGKRVTLGAVSYTHLRAHET